MDEISLDRLIGRGAQADVYLHDGQAIKHFHKEVSQESVLSEADIQQKIFKTGLPAPRVYGVATISGRPAIAMEYFKGPTLGNLMMEDPARIMEYLTRTVEMQVQTHKTSGEELPSQKEKLSVRIAAVTALKDECKQKLLVLLNTLAHDSAVCHGDFHPYNLIQAEQGYKIIDWADASCGTPAADACRSYLLYLLHGKEAAEGYLQLYCALSGIPREDILKWLPVQAGARLLEAGRGDDVSLLLRLAESSAQ